MLAHRSSNPVSPLLPFRQLPHLFHSELCMVTALFAYSKFPFPAFPLLPLDSPSSFGNLSPPFRDALHLSSLPRTTLLDIDTDNATSLFTVGCELVGVTCEFLYPLSFLSFFHFVVVLTLPPCL